MKNNGDYYALVTDNNTFRKLWTSPMVRGPSKVKAPLNSWTSPKFNHHSQTDRQLNAGCHMTSLAVLMRFLHNFSQAVVVIIHIIPIRWIYRCRKDSGVCWGVQIQTEFRVNSLDFASSCIYRTSAAVPDTLTASDVSSVVSCCFLLHMRPLQREGVQVIHWWNVPLV